MAFVCLALQSVGYVYQDIILQCTLIFLKLAWRLFWIEISSVWIILFIFTALEHILRFCQVFSPLFTDLNSLLMFVTQQRAASNEIAICYKCWCGFWFELMDCVLITPREKTWLVNLWYHNPYDDASANMWME
jgi:hypothetical protein